MARWFGKGVVVALGLGAGFGPVVGPSTARAQVRERSVTVTGPGGRTLERHFESRVGPGGIDRELSVRRPGGATLDRQIHISRPAAPPVGRMGGFVPPPPGGRNVFIERNVFVNGGGGRGGLSRAESFGLGAGIGAAVGAGAGLLTGALLSRPPAPPPPVVVEQPVVVAAPQPVVVASPPPVVVASPPPVVVASPPATVLPQPVALAMQRLQSHHDNSRRDGCLTLGRLGDDRAVPALIDRLKNDPSREVRAAAATAIGAIGDPNSAVVLERAIVYDKKQDVRDAAAAALARIQHSRDFAAQSAGVPVEAADPGAIPLTRPIESVPPPPTPAYSGR